MMPGGRRQVALEPRLELRALQLGPVASDLLALRGEPLVLRSRSRCAMLGHFSVSR